MTWQDEHVNTSSLVKARADKPESKPACLLLEAASPQLKSQIFRVTARAHWDKRREIGRNKRATRHHWGTRTAIPCSHTTQTPHCKSSKQSCRYKCRFNSLEGNQMLNYPWIELSGLSQLVKPKGLQGPFCCYLCHMSLALGVTGVTTGLPAYTEVGKSHTNSQSDMEDGTSQRGLFPDEPLQRFLVWKAPALCKMFHSVQQRVLQRGALEDEPQSISVIHQFTQPG